MAVLSQLSLLEDRHLPTTTLEGWRRFVDADPALFELLSDDDWASLPDDDRTGYNESRIAHHAELSVVTTSAIQEITNEGRLLTYYPEVVGILSVLASPYWQRMAGSGEVTEALRFYHQVASNGLTNGSPAQNTPLRSWIVKLRADIHRRPDANLAQVEWRTADTSLPLSLSHSTPVTG